MEHQSDRTLQMRARADQCLEFLGASPIARAILAQARARNAWTVSGKTTASDSDMLISFVKCGRDVSIVALIHALGVCVYDASPLVVEAHYLPFQASECSNDDFTGSQRFGWSHYCPQFLVVRSTLRPMLEDWRSTASLKREARQGGNRLILDHGRWRDIAAEECAQQYGMEHRIWTEEGFEIRCEQGGRAVNFDAVVAQRISA